MVIRNAWQRKLIPREELQIRHLVQTKYSNINSNINNCMYYYFTYNSYIIVRKLFYIHN